MNGSDEKNAPQIDARRIPDSPQKGVKAPELPGWGTKSRLLTLSALDQRTAAYRVTTQLIAEITTDLGGEESLSAAERQMVQHGAVLGAYAADLETKYLQGKHIDLTTLCTILNTQRRCFDAVGYKRRAKDVTPTLEQVLSGINEEPK